MFLLFFVVVVVVVCVCVCVFKIKSDDGTECWLDRMVSWSVLPSLVTLPAVAVCAPPGVDGQISTESWILISPLSGGVVCLFMLDPSNAMPLQLATLYSDQDRLGSLLYLA